jgi:uncharacterized protein YndB with AHSA1/START domain
MEILEELTKATSKTSEGTADGISGNNQPQVSVVGPTTAELESIKELIRFDHEYIKTEPVETVVITDDDDNGDGTNQLDLDNSMEIECKVEDTKTDSLVENCNSEFGEIDLEQFAASTMDFESLLELSSLPDDLQTIVNPLIKKKSDTSISTEKPSVKSTELNMDSVASTFSLNSPTFLEEPQWPGATSESGYGSDINSDVPSPCSDTSNLQDDLWEESFTELFPTLV